MYEAGFNKSHVRIYTCELVIDTPYEFSKYLLRLYPSSPWTFTT